MFVLIAMLLTVAIKGQTPESIKNKIKNIKLDEKYVFGESSSENREIAYDDAMRDLLTTINELRVSKGMAVLKLADIIAISSEHTYDRGEGTILVFAFIELERALSVVPKKNAQILVDNKSSVSVQSESNPSVIAENKPAVFADKQETNVSVSNDSQSALVDLNDVTRNVLEREMFQNVWGYLNLAHESGKVSQFSMVKDKSAIPSDAYVVVIARDHSVKAILTPEQNGKRLNVKSNKNDFISNYSNVAMLWYK